MQANSCIVINMLLLCCVTDSHVQAQWSTMEPGSCKCPKHVTMCSYQTSFARVGAAQAALMQEKRITDSLCSGMQHRSIRASRAEGTQALHQVGHGKCCFQRCQLKVCPFTLLVCGIPDSLDRARHQALIKHEHLPTAATHGLKAQ